MKKKVDFFIVGAPKCGTTALAEYLNATQQVFIPPIKEPHFFCDEWKEFQRVKSIDDYHSLYEKSNGRLCGDASVWYLYSKKSAGNIRSYNQDAKIIIMLREPVSAMQSLHSQLLYSGREDVSDFIKALELAPERERGRNLPKNCIISEHLFYKDVYSYEKQVLRYIDTFGVENCKIIVYEDFFKNVEGGVADVAQFLGLDLEAINGISFEKVNSNRVHRFPWLAHFVMRPPGIVGEIKEWVKNLPFLRGRPILRPVYKMFSKKQKRPPVSEPDIISLKAEFKEVNLKLNRATGVDISKW
ncbi:MAG: sulfotransferase [Pseudomonadales bacterium]|nr:sulfotransferase [Pseudomonadales bacterium]